MKTNIIWLENVQAILYNKIKKEGSIFMKKSIIFEEEIATKISSKRTEKKDRLEKLEKLQLAHGSHNDHENHQSHRSQDPY